MHRSYAVFVIGSPKSAFAVTLPLPHLHAWASFAPSGLPVSVSAALPATMGAPQPLSGMRLQPGVALGVGAGASGSVAVIVGAAVGVQLAVRVTVGFSV